MNNFILAYYQKIKDGSENVGKWILLFYQYIIVGLQNHIFFYNHKKAKAAINFIQTFIHHSKGRNDLLVLELWQKAIVSVIFGILDKNGNRQFREIVIIIARKNGKSLFAAAIIACCAYIDGEYGAEILCCAPKLDQADFVFDTFYRSVLCEEDLSELLKKRKSDLYIESTNTIIKKIPFNQKKADGFNPHLAVCDEIASWEGDKGLKQYEVLKSAMGSRRQPILLSISTSGYANESIYDELIIRSTRFLLGDSKETRLAPFLYMIDDPKKWNDISELQKSNPNLGVSISVDYLLEEIAIAENSFSKKAEFLTKYCNIKQNSSLAWLGAEDVADACGAPLNYKDFYDCYCVGGIDLSRTTDLTACVAVVEKNGSLNVFSQFYLPAEKIDEATAKDGLPYQKYIDRGFLKVSGENQVDYKDCLHWFEDLVKIHKIYPLKIGYDRYCAQYLVQDLNEDGFHADDVFQGFNLTPVIIEAEGLIKDKKINIGDNDLMKIHLLNAALKIEASTDRRKLVKISPTEHIDGCAALLDALTVRQKWYGEIGERLKNKE